MTGQRTSRGLAALALVIASTLSLCAGAAGSGEGLFALPSHLLVRHRSTESTKAVPLGRNEQLQEEPRERTLAAVGADPCEGVTCPDVSLCVNVKQAPSCLCPAARPHLLNGKCLAGPLLHADYLDPHNSARAALGLPSLTWNDSLAVSALAWARTLATCDLHHPVGAPYGQNLASVWGSTTEPPSFGIDLWLGEIVDYTYSVFPQGCAPGKKCGHYTQLMWADTKQVGCAAAPCTKDGLAGTVWACDYYPPGNYLGQYPYEQDPCFRVFCPAGSRCTATAAGTATCACAPGLALVNNVCAADPCRGVACPGNKECSAATGRPVCGCTPGLLPSRASPSLCQSPVCAGVVCPHGATCKAIQGVPVCTCAPGLSMVNNACTPVKAPTSTTSLAVYAAPGLKGVPAIIRVSKRCTNLPLAYRGRVQSLSVVWNVADGVPGLGHTCKAVFFWDQPGCCCTGWGPQFATGQVLSQFQDTLNVSSPTYAPKAAGGASVSC